MIELNTIEKTFSKPTIIKRDDGNWTNNAVKGGLRYKGIQYLRAQIPMDVYNDAILFGGKDFWKRNDYDNAINYNSKAREIKEWVKSEKFKRGVL